jgi:hypothetical protein
MNRAYTIKIKMLYASSIRHLNKIKNYSYENNY